MSERLPFPVFRRISATGPDGAGKSTAWRLAKPHLPEDLKILKIGKPTSIFVDGEERFVQVRVSKFLDCLHEWADQTRSLRLTSWSNAIYVIFQWKYQEPFWTERVKPDLVFSLRDGYADPAAYAPFYMGSSMGQKEIPERINFLNRLHGSPLRDLTIFLDVTPEEAVRRIARRLERERDMGDELIRAKWVHQHETEEGLTAIRGEFLKVLDHLRDRGTKISWINTVGSTKEMIGKALAEEITREVTGAGEVL